MEYFQRVIIIILFLLISLEAYSQSIYSEIRGQVFIPDGDASGVHVINLTKNRVTITNRKGDFQLEAQVNDTISFSLIGYSNSKLIVTENVIKGEEIYIQLKETAIDLEEVIVKPFYLTGSLKEDLIDQEKEISALSLNLPNADVKIKTQTERKFYTATDLDFQWNSIKLDPIMNAITGRTKMIKNRLRLENERSKYDKIYRNIDSTILIESFSIPGENLYEFYYYCKVDPKFDSIIEFKNYGKIYLFMEKKSLEYKRIHSKDE